MKKFMINPITGKQIEMPLGEKWDVVTIHYEGFMQPKYRAVKYNSNNVIIAERSFNTKEFAKEYIRKKENESV